MERHAVALWREQSTQVFCTVHDGHGAPQTETASFAVAWTIVLMRQGNCKQPADYHPGTDFDYWIPLDFDEHGKVQQFADFVDEFDLDL
jgi:hypothetical protein